MGLLYGIAAVALVWWLSQKFATANTTALAKALKTVGGVLAFGAAGLLALRGRIDMALLLGAVGAWLLGWSVVRWPRSSASSQRASGTVSRVRSAMIEMELDHDTGAMDGTVLAGASAGRRLGTLDDAALRDLLDEVRRSDPDGVRLLEAYLDRRSPGWREHAQADEHPRPGRETAGAMTEEEAYDVLGLAPGAGPDEIRRAHRNLMKKLHPDQGGSTYLAARVNQAKEILLGRHR
jgi:DnaJ-domain-containing protein 1